MISAQEHKKPSRNVAVVIKTPISRYLSEDIIGVTLYEDMPVQTIVFWASDYSKDYVATKPLHESQRNIRNECEEELRRQFPMLEGGRFFSMECIENYELIRELTSFGKDIIVLSPDCIRQKVVNLIVEQNRAYEKILADSK